MRGVAVPEVDPAPIGKLHTWLLTLTDAQGKPVSNAAIAVGGGMPAHGHGLPTAPRVTGKRGPSDYVIDGVKFNMAGTWLLTFDVVTPEFSDRIEYEFQLAY